MRSGRRLLLVVLLSVPGLGLAEPAVVRVFEAQVRAAPDRSAPVVHVFAENAQVSVSEEGTQGWRKVRLPDGGVGFVEEAALAFPGRPAGAGPASGPSAPAPAAAGATAGGPAAPEGYARAVTRAATTLRSIPDRSAPVQGELAAGTEVLASVELSRGFRRVKVADGRGGFAPEADLQLASPGGPAAEAPAAAVTLIPPAAPSGPPPRIYVKDLDHLAELVKDDPKVAPMAIALVHRKNGAYVVGGVGLAASTALIAVGASHFDDLDSNQGTTLFTAGIVAAGASVLVAWLIYPGRGALLDVVNEWNTRHPDRQFEITPTLHPHHAALPPQPERPSPPGCTQLARLSLSF